MVSSPSGPSEQATLFMLNDGLPKSTSYVIGSMTADTMLNIDAPMAMSLSFIFRLVG